MKQKSNKETSKTNVLSYFYFLTVEQTNSLKWIIKISHISTVIGKLFITCLTAANMVKIRIEPSRCYHEYLGDLMPVDSS